MSLIACVPNVSEGRRLPVIERISNVINDVRGVRLLHVASDGEQNRSLFTFIGTATPLRRAVYDMMQVAIEEIDLRAHRGKHPRIGAVDVVPFVPMGGTQMEKCIKLSRAVGKELAESFNVPVYLYEQSATKPERVSLNGIRKGEFEALAKKISLAEWSPDFGPARAHPTAGAVVVGARHYQTAFNITLKGADRKAADKVAKTINATAAVPRQVRALVLSKKSRSEVKISVSLYNHAELPIYRVLETAEREAKRLGAEIAKVEIVGLLTAGTLINCLEHYMKLTNFDPFQVLEMHFPRNH